MKTSDAGLNLIKQFEGLRLGAYKDSGGVPTIGYGHTATAKEGQKITKADAERLLQGDVASAEEAVKRLVKVPLSQNQFDALVSLTYNIGSGGFAGSTLLKKLNAGDKDVTKEFIKWSKDGDRRLPGLVSRRKEEAKLFG